MSILYAALNPNISSAQLVELMEAHEKHKLELIASFDEGVSRLKTPAQKSEYIGICLPLLIGMIV